MPEDLLRAAGTSSLGDRLSLVMTRLRSSGTPPRSDVEPALDRSFWLPTARTFSLTGSARISPPHPRRRDRPTGRAARRQLHRHRGLLGGTAARRPPGRGHRHPRRELEHHLGARVRRRLPGRRVAAVHAAKPDQLRPSRPADRGRRPALGPHPDHGGGRQRLGHGRPAPRRRLDGARIGGRRPRLLAHAHRSEHPHHRGPGAHREHAQLLLTLPHRHAHRHRRGGDPRAGRRPGAGRPSPRRAATTCWPWTAARCGRRSRGRRPPPSTARRSPSPCAAPTPAGSPSAPAPTPWRACPARRPASTSTSWPWTRPPGGGAMPLADPGTLAPPPVAPAPTVRVTSQSSTSIHETVSGLSTVVPRLRPRPRTEHQPRVDGHRGGRLQPRRPDPRRRIRQRLAGRPGHAGWSDPRRLGVRRAHLDAPARGRRRPRRLGPGHRPLRRPRRRAPTARTTAPATVPAETVAGRRQQ